MSLYGKINFNHISNNDDINKGSIEREPVTYNVQQTEAKKGTIAHEIDEHRRMTSAALQFQPIRRPPQAKKNIKKSSSLSVSSSVPLKTHPVFQNTSTLDYWSHKDEDLNEDYDGLENRKTAKNRKKKKKTKDTDAYVLSWDDAYDPFKPNDYEEYKMSDEFVQEMIDWKNKQEEKIEAKSTEKYKNIEQFAPPTSYSPRSTTAPSEDIASAPATILLDETAEEVYARRLAMTQNRNIDDYQSDYSTRPLCEANPSSLSLSPPMESHTDPSLQEQTYKGIGQSLDSFEDKQYIQTSNNITIVREPQMYNIETVDESNPVSSEVKTENVKMPESSQFQNNSMPGQKKFAERLMKKYGWEKGKGLGASNDGIVNPLMVKQSKDRKGTGSIINKNRPEKTGKFGKLSKVILLTNVSELEMADDDLSQEIGDECNKSYGRVERCFVYKNINSSLPSDIIRVFVLFTDTISALRAVNALDGRLFGGREINVRFYDLEKFEDGQYDA